MSWAHVSPGRYERECLDDKLPVVARARSTALKNGMVVRVIARIAICRVYYHNIVQRLQFAWVRLRHELPIIATTVNKTKFYYQVPDQQLLEQWKKASFFLEGARKLEDALPDANEIQHATLHFFPNSSEIVLRIPGWLLGGINGFNALDSLLRYVAEDTIQPTFGDEWQRLPLDITAPTDMPAPSSEGKVAGSRFFLRQKEDKFLGPSTAQSVRITIPQDRTQAILGACKAEGVIVKTAISAIIADAIKMNPLLQPESEYCTIGDPMDGSWNSDAQMKVQDPSVLLGIQGFTLPGSLGADESVTMTLQPSTYMQQMISGDLPSSPSAPMFTAGRPIAAPLMDCGDLDERLRKRHLGTVDVKLLDIDLTIDNPLSPLQFYMMIFRDELRISVTHQTGALSRDLVDSCLSNVRKALTEKFGTQDYQQLLLRGHHKVCG